MNFYAPYFRTSARSVSRRRSAKDIPSSSSLDDASSPRPAASNCSSSSPSRANGPASLSSSSESATGQVRPPGHTSSCMARMSSALCVRLWMGDGLDLGGSICGRCARPTAGLEACAPPCACPAHPIEIYINTGKRDPLRKIELTDSLRCGFPCSNSPHM
jgi:hypothetical protein